MFVSQLERAILCRLRDSGSETYEMRQRAAIILGTHQDEKWQFFGEVSKRRVDHWTRVWRWKQGDLSTIASRGGLELLEEAIRFLLSDDVDPFEWDRRFRHLPIPDYF
jgi:hypothetical protein